MKTPEIRFRVDVSLLKAVREIGDLLRRPGVPDSERRRLLELEADAQWEASLQDPWYFCRVLATTKDEHDPKSPYKPLPNLPHTYWIVRRWETERLLLIPKSRQMQATWALLCCFLWRNMTTQAQLGFVQSKKEEDADVLLQRSYGIWCRFPQRIRERVPVEYTSTKLKFPTMDSNTWAVAQGAHQFRSHTPSWVMSDEMAFQDLAEEAYIAAQPGIEGGGQYVGVSSPFPGFMETLVYDGESAPTPR